MFWYFDSGASKHITSHRDLFSSLETVAVGNSVMCANDSSYPVKGTGKLSWLLQWKHFCFVGCYICARDRKELAISLCTC